MDKSAAEKAANEVTDEFLMNMKKKKRVSINLIKNHMKNVIVRYLDLLRSQSPGEFTVETQRNVNLDIKYGVKVRIISNNLEYVGYIEEINVLGRNKHLIN